MQRYAMSQIFPTTTYLQPTQTPIHQFFILRHILQKVVLLKLLTNITIQLIPWDFNLLQPAPTPTKKPSPFYHYGELPASIWWPYYKERCVEPEALDLLEGRNSRGPLRFLLPRNICHHERTKWTELWENIWNL